MKRLFIFNFCLVFSCFLFAQSSLNAGDFVITGFNSQDPDSFSFVLLTDITNNTEIVFTDNGWRNSGSFRTNEGFLIWTATSDLACGTEVVVTDNSPFSASTGSVATTGSFALARDGDQILVYQGAESNPNFIHAIMFDSTGWSNATSAQTSALPPGLTDGVDAFALSEADNGIYDCSTTANVPLIVQAVFDENNWAFSSSSRFSLGGCTYTCCPTVTWDGSSWSGTIDNWTAAIINGNYNTGVNGSFSACSLLINSGNRLTVDNATYVFIENDVEVDGELIVETQGNFVQNNDESDFTLNPTGSAIVNKQTATKQAWYYYTYWSSPVESETINDAFPNTSANRRFYFDAANYIDADGDNIDDNGDDWTIASGSSIMTPGVGYVATSSVLGLYPSTDIATFTGPFNTGNITVTIYDNAANINESWNLIGNPYPSAISFSELHAANASRIGGVAYFWSQASPPNAANAGNEKLNFNQNDYATYTVGSGGAAGGSSEIPNGFIPSGQSFFVSGIDDGSTLVFSNDMRETSSISNSQFFKVSNQKSDFLIKSDKLWINLTSDNGVFSQVLTAYVDGATKGDDGLSYDAPKLVSNTTSAFIYSKIRKSDKKYVIQGRNPKDLNGKEKIDIGFKTDISSPILYKLEIAKKQGGILSNSKVYLKDNMLNKTHELSASAYTFTSESGEYNDRFEISFRKNLPSINNVNIIKLNSDKIKFSTDNDLKIASISIYDFIGNSIYNLKGKNSAEVYSLPKLRKAIYVAKVQLSNGDIVTKKFLM